MIRTQSAAFILLAAVAFTPTTHFAAETESENQVLTVTEVARLLRVADSKVVELAESGSLPARRIGHDWRFSRAAIMAWLQAEHELDAHELASLSGRSNDDRNPELLAQTSTSSSTETARPVGVAPDTGPTAEEIARRDQGVLLPKGRFTLEPSLSYARQTREDFPLLRLEQSTTVGSLGIRYGIIDDLQIAGEILGISRRTEIFAEDPVTGTGITDKDSDSYFGDMALSLQGVALKENIGRPSMTWSIDTVLPTGPGDVGIGGGLVLSKTYDPVVIYTGLNYLYGSDTDVTDPRRVLTKHNLSLNFGYTYAVNDSVAFSGALSGFFRSPPDSGAAIPLEGETYLLQLGMTWQLSDKWFIEPVVFTTIGGTAPDMNFVLTMPYTF